MIAPFSTHARNHLTRLICSLAVAGGLVLAGQTGLAAHASPILHARPALYDAPHITVNDEFWGPNNPHVLPVLGYSFTVNSPVVLEMVGASGRVMVEAVTTARGAVNARSAHAGTFRYGLAIPAAIQLPGARLVAIEKATGRHSNTILFHQPIPSCIHHPYTCI
jgi:hypothetical protein